jgi:ferredoxin-NADP reductase
MARFFDAELISLERPADHLWVGTFRRTDGELLKARPGQFCMIHREFDGLRLNRSYSLADRFMTGDELDTFTFAVALVDGGRFSAILDDLEVGQTLSMTGPHGRFILRDTDPSQTVMAATGTGIVPFHSMLGQIESRLSDGGSVQLFYGCRRESDFLYHDAFVRLASRQAGFTYRACASRAESPDAWTADGGRCGRITNVVKELDLSPEHAIVYLCGNPNMVAELQEHFTQLGFDRRTVRTEAYESPSDPPPRG